MNIVFIIFVISDRNINLSDFFMKKFENIIKSQNPVLMFFATWHGIVKFMRFQSWRIKMAQY